MDYKYIAYDSGRKVVEGTVEANSEGLAKDALQQSGYSLLSLKPTRQRISLRRQIPTLFGVKSKDVISFSRLLATLVHRGTNILAALEILRDETRNLAFKEIIDAVIQDLNEGSSLSNAMNGHPEAFSPMYCRMIKISEQTGDLEVVLFQLADFIEKEKALLAKTGRALVYPAFVLCVAGAVIMLLVTVTLPSFAELFAEFEGQLPLPTRLLVAFTDFANAYLFELLALFLSIVALAVWSMKKSNLRNRLDRLQLSLPLIGPIFTLREMSHLSRTLSICLSASLPMPETMDIAVNTRKNTIVAEAVDTVRGEILRGRGLAQSMAENQIFPRLLVQMVKVGEETGTLDEDLKAIAETYEADVDGRVNMLLTLLEPSLIVVLGLIVGFIAVSIIMPIYFVLGEV